MSKGLRTLTLAAAVATSTFLAAAPALADHDSTYFSIERTAVSIGTSDGSQSAEIDPVGIRLKVGAGLSHAFDLEAQFGAATAEPDREFEKFGASYAGVYLKGYLPLGFRSAIFGLGGWSWMELSEKLDDRHDSLSEYTENRSGFSYGFGIETQLSKNIDLSADYMRYSQEEGTFDEISAVNFGLKVYF